ncbi:unnamed protein product [Vitrella brassicaformis CCMP3155]|uniref:Strawberry notch AAA domain-containing protein n=1 Tax=Vitrella brassicaformis (strain CCMP3155) TaxID=1169540 RepID=A0A0G4EEC7_VITBC|nr:unnamed protein product [Vitrella brassicaformis CCMP3155]|eukprot:CEL94343.1 unnamed protein product [Vitrella brassicaformis CCMP3155]
MDEMDAARAAKRARKDEPIADDDDDEDQPEISSSESEDSDEGEDSEEDSPGGDDAMDEGYGDEGNDECMTDENALDEREGGGTGEWIYPGRRTEDGAMEPEQQHQAASSDQDDSGVMRLFSRSGVVGHIAKDHPDLLAESNTLAAVSPPPLCADLEVRIPRSVVNEGRISSPQLEPIAYFARSVGLSSLSSGGARSGGGGGGVGFFLSDGTGCGKGRVIAGTIIHLCNSGFLRHLWLSTSSDLIQDATRDIRDIKGKVAVVPLKEINASVDLDPQTAKKHFRQHGWRPGQPVVLFSSYSLLVQGGKGPNKASRVEQLIRWLSGPAESRSSSSSAQTQNSRVRSGGLIVFDEAHKAKNFKAADGPTSGQSQTGQAVYQLQVQCVHCPVLYSSATGASDIQHMAYMERLGLWGPGKAFPDFQTFKGKMSKGGVAALECVSLELKSQGKYVCRQLSFADVQFSVTQVEPSQELTDRYTQFAE